MRVNLSIKSEQLNKEDLRALLQTIRDCEMATFPDKEIYVSAEAPELSTEEMTEILTSIKPPYNYGPVIFKYAGEEQPQCSSCGTNIPGQPERIRREYEKQGFGFCETCVRSSRAYIWAEEELERRGIRKMEKLAKRLQAEKGTMHKD